MRLLLHLSRGSLFLHTSGRFSSPKRRKNSASPISNILGGSTPAFEMNGSKLGKFSSSKDMQRNVAFVSFFFRAQKTKKKKEKSCECGRGQQCHRHVHTYTHGSILWAPPTLLSSAGRARCRFSLYPHRARSRLPLRTCHFGFFISGPIEQQQTGKVLSIHWLLECVTDNRSGNGPTDLIKSVNRPTAILPSFPLDLFWNIHKEVTRSCFPWRNGVIHRKQIASSLRAKRTRALIDPLCGRGRIRKPSSVHRRMTVSYMILFVKECRSLSLSRGHNHVEESVKPVTLKSIVFATETQNTIPSNSSVEQQQNKVKLLLHPFLSPCLPL